MKFAEYKGLDLSEVGEEMLQFWKAQHIFEKSITTREGQETYVFYEGPPSANGMPGIHHVMLGTSDYATCLEHMDSQKIAAIGGGELQGTRFQMFDTQELLGFICEIAEGEPLVPDQTLSI